MSHDTENVVERLKKLGKSLDTSPVTDDHKALFTSEILKHANDAKMVNAWGDVVSKSFLKQDKACGWILDTALTLLQRHDYDLNYVNNLYFTVRGTIHEFTKYDGSVQYVKYGVKPYVHNIVNKPRFLKLFDDISRLKHLDDKLNVVILIVKELLHDPAFALHAYKISFHDTLITFYETTANTQTKKTCVRAYATMYGARLSKVSLPDAYGEFALKLLDWTNEDDEMCEFIYHILAERCNSIYDIDFLTEKNLFYRLYKHWEQHKKCNVNAWKNFFGIFVNIVATTSITFFIKFGGFLPVVAAVRFATDMQSDHQKIVVQFFDFLMSKKGGIVGCACLNLQWTLEKIDYANQSPDKWILFEKCLRNMDRKEDHTAESSLQDTLQEIKAERERLNQESEANKKTILELQNELKKVKAENKRLTEDGLEGQAKRKCLKTGGKS